MSTETTDSKKTRSVIMLAPFVENISALCRVLNTTCVVMPDLKIKHQNMITHAPFVENISALCQVLSTTCVVMPGLITKHRSAITHAPCVENISALCRVLSITCFGMPGLITKRRSVITLAPFAENSSALCRVSSTTCFDMPRLITKHLPKINTVCHNRPKSSHREIQTLGIQRSVTPSLRQWFQNWKLSTIQCRSILASIRTNACTVRRSFCCVTTYGYTCRSI